MSLWSGYWVQKAWNNLPNTTCWSNMLYQDDWADPVQVWATPEVVVDFVIHFLWLIQITIHYFCYRFTFCATWKAPCVFERHLYVKYEHNHKTKLKFPDFVYIMFKVESRDFTTLEIHLIMYKVNFHSYCKKNSSLVIKITFDIFIIMYASFDVFFI